MSRTHITNVDACGCMRRHADACRSHAGRAHVWLCRHLAGLLEASPLHAVGCSCVPAGLGHSSLFSCQPDREPIDAHEPNDKLRDQRGSCKVLPIQSARDLLNLRAKRAKGQPVCGVIQAFHDPVHLRGLFSQADCMSSLAMQEAKEKSNIITCTNDLRNK